MCKMTEDLQADEVLILTPIKYRKKSAPKSYINLLKTATRLSA